MPAFPKWEIYFPDGRSSQIRMSHFRWLLPRWQTKRWVIAISSSIASYFLCMTGRLTRWSRSWPRKKLQICLSYASCKGRHAVQIRMYFQKPSPRPWIWKAILQFFNTFSNSQSRKYATSFNEGQLYVYSYNFNSTKPPVSSSGSILITSLPVPTPQNSCHGAVGWNFPYDTQKSPPSLL